MYENWVSWFSALNILYLHLPFTLDSRGATNQCPRNASTKKKSVLNSNYEKKTLCQVKVCKKLSPCQLEVSKKLCSQSVKYWLSQAVVIIIIIIIIIVIIIIIIMLVQFIRWCIIYWLHFETTFTVNSEKYWWWAGFKFYWHHADSSVKH